MTVRADDYNTALSRLPRYPYMIELMANFIKTVSGQEYLFDVAALRCDATRKRRVRVKGC